MRVWQWQGFRIHAEEDNRIQHQGVELSELVASGNTEAKSTPKTKYMLTVDCLRNLREA